MGNVSSKDGALIAYEKHGTGPALLLVDGTLCYRHFGPMNHLSALLESHFSVYIYDRRGRGESTNSIPYAVEREIEDIEALIDEAGGSAYVYGISSGACLSLEAAYRLGDKIQKLAIYEPPYDSRESDQQAWWNYRNKLAEMLAIDQRGDAVTLFMQFVGNSPDQIGGMRQGIAWPMFESVAPTLAYDAMVIGEDRTVPVKRFKEIRTPTLVMDGGANLTYMPFMHETAVTLANAIPGAQLRTLEGQTHDVKLDILAPILAEFFS